MPERFRHGWRKWLLWAAGSIVGLVLTLVLAFVAAWQLGLLHGPAFWAARKFAGYDISCKSFDGNILGRFTCTGFTIGDDKGSFLGASRLSVDWDPWAIIHNTVKVHSIALIDGKLTRLPKSKSQTPSKSYLPSTRLDIGRADIRNFVLATPGLPEACVSIGGGVAAGPKRADADLNLVRCQPGNGQLAFKGHYVEQSGALSLAAQGRDNGALIAALSGMKGVGETRVSLSAKGTLASFNGQLHLDATNLAKIDAKFDARDLTATSLDANFLVAPRLLPGWAPQGSGHLVADVTRGPDGGFDISSAELDWGGVHGRAQLALDAHGALDGDVKLETGRTFTISGASLGGLSAHATVSGTKAAPGLRGAMSLSDVKSGSIVLGKLGSNFSVAMQESGALEANFVGNAHGAQLPAPAGGLLGEAFSFHAHATRAADGAMALNATINGAAATLTAKAEMGKENGSGHLTLTVPDLAKANAGFGGRAVATLDLPTLALDGTVKGALTVKGENIAQSGIGQALGKSPRIEAQIAAANGRYRVDDLKIVTDAVAATGSASLGKGGAIDAHLETTRGELKPLSPLLGRPVRGSFTLTADAGGTEAHPVISLKAAAPRMRVDNNIVKDAALTLDAHKEEGWKGRVTTKAKTPSGDVDLAAAVAPVADGWDVKIEKGALGPAVLSGDLAKHGERFAGKLVLKGRLLEPVGYLMGQPMQGSGTLTLEGAGKDLKLGADVEHIAAASLEDATFKADATIAGLSGPVDASFSLKDGDNHVAAKLHAELSPLAVTLQTLDGQWAKAKFALKSPAQLTMKNGQFQLDRTVIGISGGTLALQAKGGGQTLNAEVHLSDMPVAPLASLAGIGKGQGKIGLDLTADIGPKNAQAHFQLAAQDLMFAGAGKKEKPANVTMSADWDGTVLAMNGKITGLDDKDATIEAHVPVVRGAGFMPRLADSGAVSASFRAQLQAGRIMALLPIAEESATGSLSASLNVSGDIKSPQFSGKLALADGSFTDYSTGTHLEKLNLTLDATGGSKAELKLTATDGNDGTIKADGEFSMAALETGSVGRIAGHLDLNLNDAQMVREDLVTASTSGHIAVDLPGNQPPAVTGKLRTNTVRVDIGAAIPPSVPTIKVREINGGPPPEPTKKKAKPSLFSKTTLDISIDMPNRVYVTGKGADTEWAGNLKVAGTISNPDISGQLHSVRGQIELIGKTFQLDDSNVRIGNDIPGNAEIHIKAENDSSDITVTVKVDGPAADPKISWSSSPALPQSEILSHLFFGAGTPSLSVGQAFQLAQLSGQLDAFGLGGGGPGILGFARNLTGLDVLRVSAPSDLKGTGASVTAGKYITDRVYLGVKQGTDVSAGSAEVQVKITPHITLDASAGANSQSSVGVSWKWDY